jgi:hypothetical protein
MVVTYHNGMWIKLLQQEFRDVFARRQLGEIFSEWTDYEVIDARSSKQSNFLFYGVQ